MITDNIREQNKKVGQGGIRQNITGFDGIQKKFLPIKLKILKFEKMFLKTA